MLIYIYLFFTWKLSRKNLKFPANLLNSLFTSNIFLIIIILLTQKANKNIVFERIGLIVILLVEYYNIIINLMYFLTVALLIKMKNEKQILKLKNIIKYIWNYFYLILSLAFVALYFFSSFTIKNCFLGSCIVNKELKYFMEILPYKLESLFFVILFIYFFCIFKQNDKEDMEPNVKLLSKFRENSALFRIIVYEVCYFVINLANFLLKYYKMVKFSNFRYEDFCSVHDYHLVLKAVFIFLFFGTLVNDCKQWTIAFREEQYNTVDMEAEELINKIIILKQNINK